MNTERKILNAAAQLFAERGFEVPLTAIARRARVAPAALRRHFGRKQALVERVIAGLFASRWRPEWDVLLAERSIPLAERLVRFYTEYRRNTDRISTRLWTRAGLLGVHASGHFSSKLAERILVPVAREMRHAAGLANADRHPVSAAEIELAQMLHGCIAFPNTRRYVFGMKVQGESGELTGMMVRVWLPGALVEMRRLRSEA